MRNTHFIKLVGNKLVVIGYDCYATAGAVEYFIDNILSKSDGNTLVIDKDFEYRGESSLRKISIHKEAQYRIMSWNLGCMVSDEKNGEKECIDIANAAKRKGVSVIVCHIYATSIS